MTFTPVPLNTLHYARVSSSKRSEKHELSDERYRSVGGTILKSVLVATLGKQVLQTITLIEESLNIKPNQAEEEVRKAIVASIYGVVDDFLQQAINIGVSRFINESRKFH